LAVDHQAARPLVRYYRRDGRLHTLNGIGHIETVFRRAVKLFHRLGWIA
jgi:adenylate kinase family enzyme